MTHLEGSALVQFIHSNSNRFLAMALDLPGECRVLVVDGANRSSKGYGFTFEPVVNVEEYLRRAASEPQALPDEYISLLTRWCSEKCLQKADTERTLPVSSLSTLCAWQGAVRESSQELRRGAQQVAAEAQTIRGNTILMRDDARMRLAQMKQKMQRSLEHSAAVLADSSRCLQELHLTLGATSAFVSAQEHRQLPALALPTQQAISTLPEFGRRRCSIL